MSDQSLTDAELEAKVGEHYARKYGETRHPDDVWREIAPRLRSAGEPAANINSEPGSEAIKNWSREAREWSPRPISVAKRRLPIALAPAAALLFLVLSGLLLAGILGPTRLPEGQPATQATPSAPPYNLGFEDGMRWWANELPDSEYRTGIDESVAHEGTASAFIESSQALSTTRGSMKQRFQAGDYAGKRVRYTGFIRTEGVENGAALWMGVREAKGSIHRTLALEARENRPIVGTTDWSAYEIVLDVSQRATTIDLGLMLFGNGRVWLDDVRIEEVGKDVPVTGYATLEAAHNLGFESGLEGWYSWNGDNEVDLAEAHEGRASAHLTARSNPAGGEGAWLSQYILADAFAAKKVKVTGWIKTKAVQGEVELRVTLSGSLPNDHSVSEPVTGTSDWVEREVTIDVPGEGGVLDIAFYTESTGEAWLDDVQIEVVK